MQLHRKLAEHIGNVEGESPINENLMTVFKATQEVARGCAVDNDINFLELRVATDEIIHLMSVPLLQNLLYYMSIDDFEYVELYALAFIPQAVGCNEGTYAVLRDALYEGFSRDTTITDELLDDLTDILVCMEFTCSQLGLMNSDNADLKELVNDLCNRMTTAREDRKLAGYNITHIKSTPDRIDLDIHQIELFMRVEAYDLAAETYSYGRNSLLEQEILSVRKLAVNIPLIDTDELFTTYSDYYQTADFIDDLLLSAL